MVRERIKLGMTTEHGGKMEGMASFSTSNHVNEFCSKMKKCEGAVCQSCFAHRTEERYPSLYAKLVRNDWIKTEKIKKSEVPFMNFGMFRFEAFGELESLQQLENYMTIAEANKHCTFTLWTKRVDLLKKLTKKKPSNFVIIQSSLKFNEECRILEEVKHLIDGIFTVYTKDHVIDNAIEINCGDRQCAECRVCYTKSRKFKVIRELVK